MNRRLTHSLTVLTGSALLGLVLPAESNAAVLVQYNFESSPGTSSSTDAATTEATGVTGSAFDVIDNDDDSLEFSTFASDTPERSIFEFTGASTITTNTAPYWEFTVTSADPLNFDDLRFAIGRAGSGSFTARYNVSSSLDSHATLLSATDFLYSGSGSSMSSEENQIVNLNLANVDASSGIDFRIYYADSNAGSSTGGRIDTVVLNGTVVPEPASLVLLGLGTLLIAGRKRN